MTAPANLCGPAVARLRRQNGFTQHELQLRCHAAGWLVARSVLAKVENQRRSVSDYELVALAHALQVNVVKLLEAPLPRKRAMEKRKPLTSRART